MTSFTEARSRLNKQYGGAAAEKQTFIPRGAALQMPSAGGTSGGSRFSGVRERLERQYNRRSDTVRRNSDAAAGSVIGYHGKETGGRLPVPERKDNNDPLQQGRWVHGGGGGSFGSPGQTRAASDALSGAAEETDHTLSKQTYDAGMAGFEQYLADRAARLEKEADKPWWQILAENYANSPQDTSIPANIYANVVNTYRNDTSYREPDARWSDQQRSEFGNLYLQNPQKAVQYAIELNNSLNTQEYDRAKKKVEESATKSGLSILGHTAGAIAAAPYAMADFLDNVAEYSARGTITPKGGDVLTPFDYSQAVTGGVSQHLNDTYGTLDEDIPIIGGRGWGDAYRLGVSAAQSAVGGKILGKTATLATFFSSAAAAGIDNAKSRGASDEQALTYGTISGAAEVLTEMIPVDELMKMGPLADWRGFFADIVKLGGEEFLGEGTSSAITKLTDYLALGDKSSYEARKRQYQEEKQLSREAAAKAAFLDEVEEVLFDAFGGFASSSVSASAAVGGETAKQYAQKTAKVTDAESYARRLQEVMPEFAAENGDAERGEGQVSWSGKRFDNLQSSVENKWKNDILKLGIRYLNKNDQLFVNAKNIKPLEGFEDIVTHGDPISLVFKNADGRESNVSAEEFVNILMNDPNYKGGNIRLIACQVAADGGNIPRYIAQRLNVTVLAPTETVNVDFDGNMILADNDEDARSGIETGRWIYFEPKQEGGTK